LCGTLQPPSISRAVALINRFGKKKGRAGILPESTDNNELTNPGQNRSNGGQNLALKWPQKDPARFLPVSKRILFSELQEVVDAWEELPRPLKDGILAIVRGQPKKAK
jgi:hypothetical protein